MMMETVVYAREFLFMKSLYDSGELGQLQFLKASHQQDMDGWPGYWPGLPPMHYATHCVGPVLGLGRHQAEYVSCFGSGTIREEMHSCYGSRSQNSTPMPMSGSCAPHAAYSRSGPLTGRSIPQPLASYPRCSRIPKTAWC